MLLKNVVFRQGMDKMGRVDKKGMGNGALVAFINEEEEALADYEPVYRSFFPTFA